MISLMFDSFDTFHLNPKFFPEDTKKAIPTSSLIKFGVLPLGFKTSFSFFRRTKILNLGFLNPERVHSIEEVVRECKTALGESAFSQWQVYRIKPEAFVQTLQDVYHIDKEALLKIPKENLDTTLQNYLNT